MCAHALGDTLIPSRRYGHVHPLTKYRYVLHNAVMMITNSNGCPAKVELLEKTRSTRKGVQQFANW